MRASTCAAVLVVLVTAACTAAPPENAANGAVIAGRVLDQNGLMTSDTVLMLGAVTSPTSMSSRPVALTSDKTFATPPLERGNYILYLVRSPHSTTGPATTIALEAIKLGRTDVRDVTVTVRSDVEIHGVFRVEPATAEWPTHLHVVTRLVLDDGSEVPHSAGYEGAPGGRFILRNPFGRRLLDVGYTIRPGSRFTGANHRVLLDGVDVTDVPTDFSARPSSRLEIVFPQP